MLAPVELGMKFAYYRTEVTGQSCDCLSLPREGLRTGILVLESKTKPADNVNACGCVLSVFRCGEFGMGMNGLNSRAMRLLSSDCERAECLQRRSCQISLLLRPRESGYQEALSGYNDDEGDAPGIAPWHLTAY